MDMQEQLRKIQEEAAAQLAAITDKAERILLSVIAAAPFGENEIATRRSQRRRAAA